MKQPFPRAMFTNARPAAIRYARLIARTSHLLIASLPGLPILLLLQVSDPSLIRQYLALAFVAGLLCTLVFDAFGLYGRDMFSNRWLFRQIFLAWSATFGIVLVLHTLLGFIAYLPPRLLALWYFTSLALLMLSRLVMLFLFKKSMERGHFIRRSVILGMTDNALRLARHMREHVDMGSGLIGFIDERRSRTSEEAASILPHLGGMQALMRLIRNGQVDQVLMAIPPGAVERNAHYARLLRRMSVQVLLVPEMEAFNYAMPRMDNVADVPMLVVSEPPLQGWAPAYKRCEDIVLAGIALLLLGPLMLLIALAVKLESPGPALFRQKRYGYNQKLIEVYKFRSMYHHLRDGNAARQTHRHDPRVTRIGRFIRRTSLDELPQLLNVLGGSMSMVGPRPHATATKAADIRFEDAVAEYVARHKVKPGITGLAQIKGYRGETDTVEKIQKRVEFDLAYIEGWSLWLDAYILARTIPAVFSMRGAY